jgi:hypothetical protein
MNGDMSGGGTAELDVLQGDPSRVRDLSVGFGSLRTIRAEASATAPKVAATLQLTDGHIKGTITNSSDKALVARRSSSARRRRSQGHRPARRQRDLTLTNNGFNGQALSDVVVGPYDWDGSQISEAQQRKLIRRSSSTSRRRPQHGISGVLPGDQPTCRLGQRPGRAGELDGAVSAARPTSCTRSRCRSRSTDHGVQRRHAAQQAPDVSANFFPRTRGTSASGSARSMATSRCRSRAR